jgi:membrane-bound ClpP family serine protease
VTTVAVSREAGPPLSTYILAHVPGWTAVLALAWMGVAWLGVPHWAGILLVVTVLLKDVLSYRTMRRYYTPEPPDWRLVDHCGVAVTPLCPRGWVRVRGELWQAHVTTLEMVPQGAAIRVRSVNGLVLVVESPARAA